MTFEKFVGRIGALALIGLFAWLVTIANPVRAPGCAAPAVYQWEPLGALLTYAAFACSGIILGIMLLELLEITFPTHRKDTF